MGDMADKVFDLFAADEWPFLGAALHRIGDFPLVTVWNDTTEVLDVIACTDDPERYEAALQYAEAQAQAIEQRGDAPTGTCALAVTPDGWPVFQFRRERSAVGLPQTRSFGKATEDTELMTGLRRIEQQATIALASGDAEVRRVVMEFILTEVKRLIAAQK